MEVRVVHTGVHPLPQAWAHATVEDSHRGAMEHKMHDRTIQPNAGPISCST